MGFLLSMVVMLGLTNTFALIILLGIILGLIAGVGEGALVLFIGKQLEKNPVMQEKRPHFAKSCRRLGIASVSVCIAGGVTSVLFLGAPIILIATRTFSEAALVAAALAACLSVTTGLILWQVLGVRLIGISRLNKKLGEAVVHQALSVFYKVLGIVTLIPGILFIVFILASIFGGAYLAARW